MMFFWISSPPPKIEVLRRLKVPDARVQAWAGPPLVLRGDHPQVGHLQRQEVRFHLGQRRGEARVV